MNKYLNTWKQHTKQANVCVSKKQYINALAHFELAIDESIRFLDHFDDKNSAISIVLLSFSKLAALYYQVGDNGACERSLQTAYDFFWKRLRLSKQSSAEHFVYCHAKCKAHLMLLNFRQQRESFNSTRQSKPEKPNLINALH